MVGNSGEQECLPLAFLSYRTGTELGSHLNLAASSLHGADLGRMSVAVGKD